MSRISKHVEWRTLTFFKTGALASGTWSDEAEARQRLAVLGALDTVERVTLVAVEVSERVLYEEPYVQSITPRSGVE